MMFNGYDKVRLGMAVLLCLCSAVMVRAKVKLPALISDGMVLQREQTIKVLFRPPQQIRSLKASTLLLQMPTGNGI